MQDLVVCTSISHRTMQLDKYSTNHCDWSYKGNEDHCAADDNTDVDFDTGACTFLLLGTSVIQGLDGQDEGGDGQTKEDKTHATCNQRAH